MTNQHRDALSQLHRRYAESMLRLTYLRTRDVELSRDLVQDAFFLACCKPEQVLEQGDNSAAWLYRALEYLTMRELAKAYRKEVPLTDEGVPTQWNMLPLSDVLPIGLASWERDILTWRMEDRLPYENIAQRCGLSEQACRKRYSRALAHCKKLLRKDVAR